MKVHATAFAALCILSWAARSRATSGFPPEIVRHLGIACADAPSCTICHQTSSGGRGSATRPFGVEARSLGLAAYDIGSLDRALDDIRASRIDSNCDGVADIDELTACAWPVLTDDHCGIDGGEPVQKQAVTYGCTQSSSNPDVLAIPFVVALVASVARRRRRNSEKDFARRDM